MSRELRPGEGRLRELLAGWAMGDLSPEELRELEQLVDPETRQRLGEEFELTAAALDRLWSREPDAAAATGVEPLPPAVRRTIQDQARRHATFRRRQTAAVERPTRVIPGIGWREMVAWVALAASLLVAVGLWFRSDRPSLRPVDLAAARQELQQSAADLIAAEFGPGKTPLAPSARGDVVWSNARQQGYLRLAGLPANDPSREQYQLWIIDPQRDAEPIDGGVFDIATSGETIVPIAAKLRVLDPQAFAITIEKPGGVVVSTQERLPLLAVVRR